MTEAKPATDEEITAIRMTLPEQAHQMSPAALVMQLIARIDTERAARLAAEARVKALEDAGEEAFHVLAGCDCDNGVEHAGMNEGDHHKSLALDRLRSLLPAFKEPANG